MKTDSIILVLLIAAIALASFFGGAFWRLEEVHKLRGVIDLKNTTLTQTEVYLNQFDFNDIARNNWRQLGYSIYSKNDSVNFKK